MSDLIETIREKIHNSVGTGFCHALNCKPADEKCKCCEHPAMMQCSNEILDEEAAKEPQKCDSDCISRKKLIEDLDKLTHPTGNECEHMLYKNDVISTVNNQPQVQQIVRTPEEIALKIQEFDSWCSNSGFCYWLNWLTGKEV